MSLQATVFGFPRVIEPERRTAEFVALRFGSKVNGYVELEPEKCHDLQLALASRAVAALLGHPSKDAEHWFIKRERPQEPGDMLGPSILFAALVVQLSRQWHLRAKAQNLGRVWITGNLGQMDGPRTRYHPSLERVNTNDFAAKLRGFYESQDRVLLCPGANYWAVTAEDRSRDGVEVVSVRDLARLFNSTRAELPAKFLVPIDRSELIELMAAFFDEASAFAAERPPTSSRLRRRSRVLMLSGIALVAAFSGALYTIRVQSSAVVTSDASRHPPRALNSLDAGSRPGRSSPGELRILLAGDPNDPSSHRVQAALRAKFEFWRARFVQTNATTPGCTGEVPRLSYVHAEDVSDSTMDNVDAVLGIRAGSMEPAVSDAGLSLREVITAFNSRPLVRRLGVTERLAFVYRFPPRPGDPHIDYRPTSLRFEPALPIDANNAFLNNGVPTFRDMYSMRRGSVVRQWDQADQPTDVPRLVQNLNYSRWSELALFERPEVVRLTPVASPDTIVDERALRNTIELLLYTWAMAPTAFAHARPGEIEILPTLRWISRDADSLEASLGVPGPVLGALRRFWADLLVPALGVRASVCGHGAPPGVAGDDRAEQLFGAYCGYYGWQIVAEAYERAGRTVGFSCPECMLLAAESRLAMDDYAGAATTLEHAAQNIRDSRLRAITLAQAARVLLITQPAPVEEPPPPGTMAQARRLIAEVRRLGFEDQADFEEARIVLLESGWIGDTGGNPAGLARARQLLEALVNRRPRHALSNFLLAKLLMGGDTRERARATTLLEGILSHVGSTGPRESLGELDLVEYDVQPRHVLADLVDLYRTQGRCGDMRALLATWGSRLPDSIEDIDLLTRAQRTGSFWYFFPDLRLHKSWSESCVRCCS